MILRLLLPVLLGLFVSLAFPGKAQAQRCSATITDVDFGAPSPLSTTPTDAIATVTATCTGIPLLTQVKMCPSIGEGSGGASGSGRLMTGPGNAKLAYQLYQDASRTQAWGAVDNPALGTVPVLTIGNGFSGSGTANVRLFARLFGSQATFPPGTYQSVFTGAEAAFTYSLYFVGIPVGCTGFVGSAVIHPDFEVSARPPAGCTLTTTDLVFPATGVIRSAIHGEASIRVSCTSRTVYSVSLDNGITGTAPASRRMTSAGGDGVTYALYRNPGRTALWGSAPAGLSVTGTGTGSEQTLTVYGLVPAQATPRPGSYSDRIVVTLTY